jgi:hypothetical protein
MLQQEPYSVYEGQSLFDVSVALYGDASKVMQLAYENNLSVTDKLFAGQQIKPVTDKQNFQVLQVYKQNKTIPATTLGADLLTGILKGGIGYMQIGNNFKVS